MRGTLAFGHDLLAAPGIIPAYAGNTELAGTAYMAGRDHPRVCGEHLYLLLLALVIVGSSPRMRGTHLAPNGLPVQQRIIPAYAGNTERRFCRSLGAGDHPRVCGEHRSGRSHRVVRRGSSPRMRGTRGARRPRRQNHGIIPAYAGNTGTRLKGSTGRRDHPRVCGEHLLGTPLLPWQRGSSPRMRGTHPPGLYRRLVGGIIPAYAGNTPAVEPTPMAFRDHPRVCGEHLRICPG